MKDNRRLIDLFSVGPRTVEDLNLLGITRVEQLVGQSADSLFARLGVATGKRHDPCCIDVFRAAIAQAEDPELPEEKRRWHYWSKIRKSGH